MRLPQYVGYGQDGNRIGYHYTPKGIVAPSGLRIADASTKTVDDLNAQGLYPCVPPVETPDPEAVRITGFSDALIGDRAQLSWVTVDLTADEIAARLAAAQDAATRLIDDQADNAADRLVEGLSARKLEEYKRAADQAEALLAEADPDNPAGSYPALQADVEAGTTDPRDGSTVATLAQAAEVILLTRAPWESAMDEIRRQRLIAKNLVRAATTKAEVQAALDAIVWPGDGEAQA